MKEGLCLSLNGVDDTPTT